MKYLLTDYPLNVILLFALALVAFEGVITLAILGKPHDGVQTQSLRYRLALIGAHVGAMAVVSALHFLGSPGRIYHEVQTLVDGSALIGYMYEVIVTLALCAPVLMLLALVLIRVFPAKYAKYDSDANPIPIALVRDRRRPTEYLFR